MSDTPQAPHAGHSQNHDHDHAACGCGYSHSVAPAATLQAADEYCAANGLRLTPQRRAVLAALAEAARPCGAYELIEALRAKNGRALAPIAIYRALEFLKEHGLIHRLELLNAFIACPHRHHSMERVVFLICEACRQVEEAVAAPLNASLAEVARAHGFAARRQVVELSGLCRDCNTRAAP